MPTRPRHAWGRVLALASALWIAAAAGASTQPAAGGLPQRFWDRYMALRDLWRADPDSASATESRLRRRDPDDFLAAWLRGQLLASTKGDSSAAVALSAQARQAPGSAGLQVAEGTLRFARGEIAAGRAALQRAHDAYARDGRASDASRALFWKVVPRKGAQIIPEITSDLAAAETAARALGDPDALADVLLTRAEIEYRQSAKTALATRTEALALLAGLPPGYQLIECHRQLSNAYKSLGELKPAREHCDRALELSRALGSPRQEVLSLRARAHLDRAEGRLALARDEQLAALEVSRGLRDEELVVSCYGDLGNLARDMGRYAEARDDYGEALRRLGPGRGDSNSRVMLLDALASIECLLGNYRDARARYEEALALCRARGLGIRAPLILADLAQLHLDTADPEGALATAEEGVAAAAEAGNVRSRISLLLLEARALQELGRDEPALQAARAGRRLARDGVPHMQWTMMRTEAQMLDALGRRSAADALLDSTAALFAPMPDSLELAITLRLQGEIRQRSGLPARALPLLQRSRDMLVRLNDPLATAQSRLALGRCLLALGRAREAAAELDPGLRALEGARSSFAAAEERAGFATRWYDAYADLARAHVALGRTEAAFADLERGRGRGLREALALDTAGVQAHVAGELGARFAAVEAEITGLQSTLRREYALEKEERSPGLDGLERRADSLKTVWSDLALRVEREAPDFAREIGRMPAVTAGEVRSSLRPGERLVAYLVGDEATLVFSFAPERLSVREIPWGEAALSRRVAEFVNSLRDGSDDAGGGSGSTEKSGWRGAAAALADTLLADFDSRGAGERPLYVLPDGPLHLLPFEALLVPGLGGRRVHLVERAPVVYASSATLLLHPAPALAGDRAGPDRIPLVAFGDPATLPDPKATPDPTAVAESRGVTATPDSARGAWLAAKPLPHARREVEMLAGLVPGARAFVGADATEERFWGETAHARWIHVAAHAFADERHPEFSGIVLSSPGKAGKTGAGGEKGPGPKATGVERADDGILQAHEIAAHRQDVSLVTLSACESGAGRLLRGEGLLSLGRAFRLMGARNLVVSLWEVDDASTMRFMTEFYRRLSRGEAPPTALRDAKLAMLGLGTEADDRIADEPGARVSGATTRGVGRRSLDQQAAAPSAWAPFVLLGERAP